jgi:hypothetical protein
MGLRRNRNGEWSGGCRVRLGRDLVVSHEVIPQTHQNGHQTPATIGLMLGFALMMVLDTTLG